MNRKIVRTPDVIEMTSLSKQTIYRLMKVGKFPQAMRIADRAYGWLLSDIEKWIDDKIAGRSTD